MNIKDDFLSEVQKLAVQRPRGLFSEGEPDYFRSGPILISKRIIPPSLFHMEEKLQAKLPRKFWDSSDMGPTDMSADVRSDNNKNRGSLPDLDLVKNVQ